MEAYDIGLEFAMRGARTQSSGLLPRSWWQSFLFAASRVYFSIACCFASFSRVQFAYGVMNCCRVALPCRARLSETATMARAIATASPQANAPTRTDLAFTHRYCGGRPRPVRVVFRRREVAVAIVAPVSFRRGENPNDCYRHEKR
jgi:hypothetical protein